MTPKQFRNAIMRLGLSQEAAGEFFGYSGRQGQRWANNEREVPVAVAIAIKLMIQYGIKPEDLQ